MRNIPLRIAIVYDQSVVTSSDRHIPTGLHAAFPTAILFTSTISTSSGMKMLDCFFANRQLGWFIKLDLSHFYAIISYGTPIKRAPNTQPDQLHAH